MSDQVIVLLRYLLTMLGTYGAAKGWFTSAEAGSLVNGLITVLTAAVPVAMTVIGIVKSSKTSKVADVQAMPDMQVVTTSQAIKDAVPEVTKASPTAATVTAPVPKPSA